MAGRKISWNQPVETTVTRVEISKSPTLYGTYTVSTTIHSTSAADTWVTDYTDSSGIRTDYYKIRFAIGTAYYSDYSDPATSEELTKLCSVSDVKKYFNTVGRWTDSEVFDTIIEEDERIYEEFGTPIQSSWTEIGKIDSTVQTRYYVGEEKTYRIDRVFYGTTTKTELYLDDGFRANNTYGMVEILPVGSSGVTPSTDCDIEIHYVPGIFNKLCIRRTIVNLLEQTDLTSAGKISKELQVARDRLAEIETIIANRYCLQTTSSLENYDKFYGVNLKKVEQDADRNRYISSTGWD